HLKAGNLVLRHTQLNEPFLIPRLRVIRHSGGNTYEITVIVILRCTVSKPFSLTSTGLFTLSDHIVNHVSDVTLLSGNDLRVMDLTCPHSIREVVRVRIHLIETEIT